jgi:hypothetical protein
VQSSEKKQGVHAAARFRSVGIPALAQYLFDGLRLCESPAQQRSQQPHETRNNFQRALKVKLSSRLSG